MWKNWKCDVTQSLPPPSPCHKLSHFLRPPPPLGAWHTLWTAPKVPESPNFLRPAQRYDDFKPSKTAVVLIAGVTRGPGLSNPTSFLRPCSPNGTDNRQQRQRQTERPPPEPSNILKRFYALYDDKIRYYKKKVSKLYCMYNPLIPSVPFKRTLDFGWNCKNPWSLMG